MVVKESIQKGGVELDKSEKKYLALNFKRYLINSIDFKYNPEYTGGKANMDIEFGHSVAVKNSEARVSLKCMLFRKAKKEEKPFHLEVHMTGIFEFQTELEGEELNNVLRHQGINILFPYLRAVISNITGNTGLPPIILPLLNVNQLIKNQVERAEGEH